MLTCPSCKGERYTTVLARVAGSGCKRIEMSCSTCQGAGEVDDDYPRRRNDGRKLKAWRLKRDLSMREACRRFNISPVDWSHFEFGRTAIPGFVRHATIDAPEPDDAFSDIPF